MCSDLKGGVLCLDAGCSAPWLNCSHLAASGLCHARWRHLSPFARVRAFVWQKCLASCGLSLRDGDLNGSYCRWANEQIGRRALAFNADLSIEF